MALALPVAFCCGVFAAQSPAQTEQAKPAYPGNLPDPTKPEAQRRLDVDRDPIPSPDGDEDATANATQPSGTKTPGELQKDQNGIYTLHEDVDEVLLNCAVVDEKGRPVENLSRNDFHIWEDGVPQTTTSFVHQDLPVSVGILVDNSGSMRDKRAAVNAAAIKLLQDSNPKDAAFVVNFNDRAYLDQGFTSDLVALNRGLSHFDSRGTTALYDAVAASADELSKHAKQPKQVLLIVTDGADNASRLDLQQAIRRVQNLGGPVVYCIGMLFDAEAQEEQKAHHDLDTLSEETGGIAYFPRSLQDVDSIADEVARDIRNQYTVGYHSTRAANLGGYRVIHVEVTAPKHGKLIVRTRRGYYAKPGQRNTAQATPEAHP